MKKKLTKTQKEKLAIVLSWYNLAWAMCDRKRSDDQKRVADKAAKMIEDIIL